MKLIESTKRKLADKLAPHQTPPAPFAETLKMASFYGDKALAIFERAKSAAATGAALARNAQSAAEERRIAAVDDSSAAEAVARKYEAIAAKLSEFTVSA